MVLYYSLKFSHCGQHFWPFVRGIHWSPHKGPVIQCPFHAVTMYHFSEELWCISIHIVPRNIHVVCVRFVSGCFIHILQGNFTCTGAITWLFLCLWRNSEYHGQIIHTKRNKTQKNVTNPNENLYGIYISVFALELLPVPKKWVPGTQGV